MSSRVILTLCVCVCVKSVSRFSIFTSSTYKATLSKTVTQHLSIRPYILTEAQRLAQPQTDKVRAAGSPVYTGLRNTLWHFSRLGNRENHGIRKLFPSSARYWTPALGFSKNKISFCQEQ